MPACVVDDVAWDVSGDFGLAPFVLDRDLLDADPGSELTPAGNAIDSLGELVLAASWAWGASSGLGPLTEPAAGSATVSLLDTERLFDPLNPDSPLAGYLRIGAPLVISADGQPAFTGSLRGWSHDLGTSESTLAAIDPVGEAGLEPGAELAVGAGTTGAQALEVLTAVGWQDRVAFAGGSSASRTAVTVADGPLLTQLRDIRVAELAELSATRAGGLLWRGRGEDFVPAPSVVVNCGGVFLSSLVASWELARVRNVVAIRDHVPATYEDAASIDRNGRLEVSADEADLAFA